MPALLLASSSPYRRQLLARLGLDFDCASPDIDESPLPDENAAALCLRLAENKARALAPAYPEHLIIGSDQVLLLDGEAVSKPDNHAAAVAQLQRCSGQRIRFSTALCLLNSRTGKMQTAIEPFDVVFRTLDDATIERYLQAEKPYDCAGSFKSEGLGISLFEALHGNDPNSLIGLPLIRLCTMLRNEGVQLP
ncbi:Maf family protein [Halopseudomonas salegens]|uniref:7-methyl-GTP pyrophosphatase n=1 Tax=Halopseudomonas salegens TaxID=1434072 RepID=A0A1H2EZ93_9GAMM|nr:Maf family nucleotide pyrophosphatase [Halopseudomonas salegens]SDU00440.1 MAF protein [Halopseudomonas salegens]